MAFFRQRMQQTPGFVGGTLEEQLARALDIGGSDPRNQMDQPNPQVLTPQDQQSITRPRRVDTRPASIREFLSQRAQEPVTTTATPESEPSMRPMQPTQDIPVDPNAPFGSSGEPFGGGNSTRPRRTQMRDYVADNTQYLRDLENEPRNWKDKTVDTIRALNSHFNPDSRGGMPTKRERNIQAAQGAITRDLAIGREKSLADTREAAILAGQERVRQGDERLSQGEKRIKQQQRQTLASVLNRMDEFDPEAPENLEMVNALRANEMPVVRKKRGQQLKFVQNASTGQWEVVAGDKTTGAATSSTVTTPEGAPLVTDSEQKLTRDNSNVQLDKKLRFQSEMKSLDRAAAEKRARIMVSGQNARLGDPDEYEAMAGKLESEAETASDGTAGGKQTAARLRTLSTEARVMANKARSAQGATGTAPKAGRTIEGAIESFKKNRKVNPTGRAPSADEIARMKAALGQ